MQRYPMSHSALLSRRPHKKKAQLSFLNGLELTLARAHELCGHSRRVLALMIAQNTQGPIFWIRPSWVPDQLNADGVLHFINPGRINFVTPQRPEDLLWCMEEVLRTGAVPLVVGDLPGLPGLTAVRRLHLAAETGTTEGKHAPAGLLLTPDNGGAQGVESRWHMAPRHQEDCMAWLLERRRARTTAVKSWRIEQHMDQGGGQTGGQIIRVGAETVEPDVQPKSTARKDTETLAPNVTPIAAE
jgi:protein ImuA